jgi:hypothetical protein
MSNTIKKEFIMRQWTGRRAGDELTEHSDANAAESPDANLHRSVKTAIAQHKKSLVRAQSLLRDLSVTLTEIKENVDQSNTFKKS